MERYQASRNTIRKAIDLVYQQGLLRRVQGSGYYITNIQLQHKTVVNLSARSLFNSHVHPRTLTSKILTFDTIHGDSALSRKLNIPVDEELYRIIRLRYWHDQLYCLEKAYYLRSVVPIYRPKLSIRQFGTSSTKLTASGLLTVMIIFHSPILTRKRPN